MNSFRLCLTMVNMTAKKFVHLMTAPPPCGNAPESISDSSAILLQRRLPESEPSDRRSRRGASPLSSYFRLLLGSDEACRRGPV